MDYRCGTCKKNAPAAWDTFERDANGELQPVTVNANTPQYADLWLRWHHDADPQDHGKPIHSLTSIPHSDLKKRQRGATEGRKMVLMDGIPYKLEAV